MSRERLGILREKYGNESPQVAIALNDLAVARMRQGDMAGAEKIYNEAIEMSPPSSSAKTTPRSRARWRTSAT